MSDSQEIPWSYNNNAPKITYDVYFREKTYFAGILIASIPYGAPKTLNLYVYRHSSYSFGMF